MKVNQMDVLTQHFSAYYIEKLTRALRNSRHQVLLITPHLSNGPYGQLQKVDTIVRVRPPYTMILKWIMNSYKKIFESSNLKTTAKILSLTSPYILVLLV